MVMGGLFDWDDDRPARSAAGRPIKLKVEGGNRKTVTIICCPGCESIDVHRKMAMPEFAYWHCLSCGNRWKEMGQTGSGGVGRIV
jgi:ribosomal protein L37AE/L43A